MNEVAVWSDLPHDILAIICKPLTVPDIFSFASVCRSWRSAAALNDVKEHLFRFKTQKPWLLFSGAESTVANLYSPSDNRFFAIPNQPTGPSPVNTYFVIGSDYGWIIAADDRSDLLLLNPITRQRIDLPPTSTFDHVTPRFKNNDCNQIITGYGLVSIDGAVDVCYQIKADHSVEELRYYLYWKACLSSSPSTDDDYTVVVLLDTCKCFALAKPGDKRWTVVFDAERPLIGVDMVFHHDDDVSVVHFTDFYGKVMSCDLNSTQFELTLTFPPCEWDSYHNSFYMVYSPWGDLLYVRRVRKEDCPNYWTLKIEVYKINLESKTLLKVEDLGQYALFVGGNNPVCISVEDAPLLKKGCVYFTDEYLEFSLGSQDIQRDIGIYDLSNGLIEHILPNDSRLFWPPPVWVTPSLL